MEVLVALVAAGESKTRAEAAEKLKITISGFDKRLRTATSIYGVPLVQQRGDELTLTEDGQVFCESASRSLELASYAEQSLHTHLLLKTHHVLVGHSSYLAPSLLAMIHGLRLDSYPRVQIDHRPGLTGVTAQAVRGGELHAGFGFLPLTVPDLVIRKIWDEPLAVCIPASHSLASRPVIRPEDIEGQAIIAVGREPMPGMHEEMEERFASMGVKLRVTAEAFAPTEALTLVDQEVGLCILAQSSAVANRGVAVRPLWTRALRRESAFFHRDDDRSLLVTELSKTVLQQAKELGRSRRLPGRRPV